MSSIATAVFKATIGLLINKARDTVAEKLKEGDVTDEKFRSLILREIDQINSKLDGLARKDLLSSISALKEGIAILFDVFKQASRAVKELRENATGQGEAASATDASEDIVRAATSLQTSVSLANELDDFQVIGMNESSKELLSDAKERFKEARSKARDAFSNKALNTAYRILAMMTRVIATILEKVDSPRNALTPCRVCLEELHALPAVQESFKIALAKGWKSWFRKDERNKTIAAVCDVNHAIFDLTQMVGSSSLVWPPVDIGTEDVHPLRDTRVAKISQQGAQYIGYFPVQWSFGADRLHLVSGICTNTQDQFIVADSLDSKLKVFDSDGNLLHAVEIGKSTFSVHDVATDQNDNVYVLCTDSSKFEHFVRIFDNDNNMQHCFVVEFEGTKPYRAYCLTVVETENSKQVFVLGKRKDNVSYFRVIVYEADGTFVRGFSGPERYFGRYDHVSITSCNDQNDGRVMVLDRNRVYVFSEEGKCQHRFSVGEENNPWKLVKLKAGAILWENKHVIVISICTDCFSQSTKSSVFGVSIYSENGELVQQFTISSRYEHFFIWGITMNSERRIALALSNLWGALQSEILVL